MNEKGEEDSTGGDELCWGDVKAVLTFSFVPKEVWLPKFDMVFKFVYWCWYAFMIYTCLFMVLDFRSHPELYHYVEGVSGVELEVEEHRYDVQAVEFFTMNVPEVGVVLQDFPDWVYLTSKEKAFVHLGDLVMGRVGLFFFLTIFVFAFKVRLLLWKLYYAKVRIKGLEVVSSGSVL